MEEPTPDARAVRLAQAGERRAFEELLDRYRNRVYSFLYRVVQHPTDAEDLAQETFLKAFRNLAAYDPRRPFISWLFRIAHNSAIDLLRARRPETLSIDDPDAPIEVEDPAGAVDRGAERESERVLFDRLLAAMPLPYREVLLLRHREELDYARIAEVLGIPQGTVKIRLFRARDMMRKKLEACGYGA